MSKYNFIPNHELSISQISGRIANMKDEITKHNHEREEIDAEINRLKSKRTGVCRRVSNCDRYRIDLEKLLIEKNKLTNT